MLPTARCAGYFSISASSNKKLERRLAFFGGDKPKVLLGQDSVFWSPRDLSPFGFPLNQPERDALMQTHPAVGEPWNYQLASWVGVLTPSLASPLQVSSSLLACSLLRWHGGCCIAKRSGAAAPPCSAAQYRRASKNLLAPSAIGLAPQ